MSLSRVKVWNPGDVLTAADLNGEFNNVLNNPLALVSPTTGPINFNLQAHTGIPLSAVSGTSGTVGYVATLGASLTPVWNLSQSAQPARMGVNGLSGSATGQIVSLAFDQATLLTTNKTIGFNVTATSSFDISCGTSGPGGKDQSAMFASTFVHAFAISTGLGSTMNTGILSTNLVPTMPTSYTAYAYLTTLQYSSASTTFTPTYQAGDTAFYENLQNIVAGFNSTFGTISMVPQVPAVARRVLISVSDVGGTADGGGNFNAAFNLLLTSGTIYRSQNLGFANGAGFTFKPGGGQLSIPNLGQGLMASWVITNAASVSATIDTQGYVVPNGDV